MYDNGGMLTDEQKALRMTGLGGSDIAAAVGLSPWRTPLQLYRQKRGELEVEETWRMFLGNVLEDAILKMHSWEWGSAHERLGTVVHPEESWVLATPDSVAMLPDGRTVLVEAKRADYKRPDWGKQGTDEVPVAYVCQVLWTMHVLRARGYPIDEAHVAAFFRGSDFQTFVVPFDAARVAWLVEEGRKFWFNHVVAEEPPAEREAA